MAKYEILKIHDAIVEEYAEIREQLKENETPIPENDTWIVAICKGNFFNDM